MTSADTTKAATPSESDATTVAEVLTDYIGRRAAALQRAYQADEATAVATLARLRRVVPTGRGLSPDAWDVFDGMPERLLGKGDEPSPAEYAAVAALALFATHQQSRRDAAMHAPGFAHSIGRAVSRLSAVTGSQGVERRFHALARSSDITAVLQHLRGLTSQLRAERIPVDYGALARDLYRFQFPDGPQSVRIRWTRDFRRPIRDDTNDVTQTGDNE